MINYESRSKASGTRPIMSGLSGNEIFCLALKGLSPGELVVGNSVFSLGFLGSLGAVGRTLLGGEVSQVTQIIHEGRLEAFQRLAKEASDRGGVGLTGVTSELRSFHGRSEFLSIASTVHQQGQQQGPPGAGEQIAFSSSADGQELYCQLDAGFEPRRFVFGNVAYSVGAVGGIVGKLKSLARGEIKEFSDVFNRTRHLALQRIAEDAFRNRASCVVGIETRTLPWAGTHEMLMLGTASTHSLLPMPASAADVVTSDLTNEEMWNLARLGYMPLKLVLGTAVYSLGVIGGITAMFKGLTRGEVPELTSMIYDAREHAIGLLRAEATAIGADDVVGLKTHVQEHGGLLEFLAIGTAIKKVPGMTTQTESLPVQAVIRDRDTWIDDPSPLINRATSATGKSAGKMALKIAGGVLGG